MPSRAAALALAGLTLVSVGLLLAWDVVPARFPDGAHQALGAAPLALIALAYLVFQGYARPGRGGLLRAAILALAFLCWAVNQLLGDGRPAVLFNDLAIALFVLDVFLTVAGWPAEDAPPASLP